MISISYSSALDWTSKIIGIALFFQTLELLSLRKAMDAHGVWRWNHIRKEFATFPLATQKLLAGVLGYRGFIALLVLRLISGAVIVIAPHPVLIAFLLISTVLISLRWRGSFNGGSDFMTLIVLMALTVAAVFRDVPAVGIGCLWYVAIQTCTSYFIAGMIKLRRENWRKGKALRGFLNSTIYDPEPIGSAISSRAFLAMSASWIVMLFECAFPIALINSKICLAVMGLAFLFHLANFYFFGLNRFLLSWSAAYPALFFCSQLRGGL